MRAALTSISANYPYSWCNSGMLSKFIPYAAPSVVGTAKMATAAESFRISRLSLHRDQGESAWRNVGQVILHGMDVLPEPLNQIAQVPKVRTRLARGVLAGHPCGGSRRLAWWPWTIVSRFGSFSSHVARS